MIFGDFYLKNHFHTTRHVHWRILSSFLTTKRLQLKSISQNATSHKKCADFFFFINYCKAFILQLFYYDAFEFQFLELLLI